MAIKGKIRGGVQEVGGGSYPLGSATYPSLTGQANAFTGRGEASLRNKAFEAQSKGDLATYNSLLGQLK